MNHHIQFNQDDGTPYQEPPMIGTHLRIQVTQLTYGPRPVLHGMGFSGLHPERLLTAEVEFTLYVSGLESRSATFRTQTAHGPDHRDAREDLIRNWHLESVGWVEEMSTQPPNYDEMTVEIIDRNDFLKWLGLDLTAIFKQQANEPTQQPVRLIETPPGARPAK